MQALAAGAPLASCLYATTSFFLQHNLPSPTGRVFLVHTKLGGTFTLRMALGSTTTQPRHVREAWRVIQAALNGQPQQ